jgi:tetratricopeptide (TPR) repeat protein
MQCPRCQAENPTGMKFCGQCAAPLAAACPSCGTSNPPANKFCGQCAAPLGTSQDPRFSAPESYTPKHLAEKILTSKAALEGERKQVTVLCADLKGSMELLAGRDPEEARKLLDPVLERMMEAVHRYEGTVNQVMGDGIMALFGAPLAHEDHAVRACYAALRMQESVKKYADEVRRSHAAVIKIRVTVKSLGNVSVKGLAAPVEVYEVTGAGAARTRLQAAAQRGLTRFVGRDAEIEQLHRAVEHARQGRGQVAAVVGGPGVGKSRLTFELTHSHRLDGWLILQAGALSYGNTTSYLPVIDLLKNYFRIGDRESPREIREKVTGRVLMLNRALEPTLPALFALLDVSGEDPEWQALDPPQRRQRTLDTVKHLLLREAQLQPLLVAFEDLHWIDSETQALLDSLVESLPPARLLLLVNYRPEYEHHWGSKTSYTQLRLDPLPPESAFELLHGLLGEDRTIEPLTPILIERTEGNPFFLEETVRALVETKALVGEHGAYRLAKVLTDIQVPATVQAVLAARIDRLSPEDKRLLQAAAVIGKDVPFAVLLAIAELPEGDLRRGLAHLEAAELLYETSLFPDLEYTFKHALTHEVTYGGLLQERRRALHARILDTIETLHRDRLGEHIERLAYHALRGELREKAVRYLRQAGGKASAQSALQDAQAWFEQALSVLDALPESQATLEQGVEIRLELRPVQNLLGEVRRTLERLREAETLAEKLNDDRRRGRVYAFMTTTLSHLGELDEALVTGTQALEIAGRLGDLRLRILTTTYLEQAHYYRGDYERVVELATDNLAALPAAWIHESFGSATPISSFDRYWLVRGLAELGRFAEAAQYEAEAFRLAEPTHHAYTVGTAHFTAGWLHLLKGDWAQACSLIEHGIAAHRTGNIVLGLPPAVASLAWVLAQVGEVSEALTRLREGEELLERHAAKGITLHRGWGYHALGCAGLLLGRLDEARSLGDRALKYSPSHPGSAAHALHLLGDITTHRDRFDAESGEAHYHQALALAEPRGMRPLVAHCHLGLGKLYRRTDKREQAREHLTTATTMYREMDMRFWLEQAEAEMGELA